MSEITFPKLLWRCANTTSSWYHDLWRNYFWMPALRLYSKQDYADSCRFLNFRGWILKCVNLDSADFQMSPSKFWRWIKTDSFSSVVKFYWHPLIALAIWIPKASASKRSVSDLGSWSSWNVKLSLANYLWHWLNMLLRSEKSEMWRLSGKHQWST
jgi:hypothetical protein